ncbi:DinB family protein [Psychroserpens luteolus]|uniref:DinB family protein n=1 Tax=Psychroserpens luteolus TaxID=2855840 RepID=UPI001E58EB2D|nr:DinB family protein [Psychroserpens luteolus]MCD2259403.1 DinB family protein [Psychroserpens luteolus]
MLTDTLIKLYTRDLNQLKTEVSLYTDEKKLWLVTKDISNSAGNLCLHIVGNLNHFIGETIGNSGYVRQRDLEFSLKDVPREDLIKQVDDTIIVVSRVLKGLTESDLQKEYKRRVFEDTMTTEYFLVHLVMHLSYHLGQINYHRRLLDS